MKGNSEVIMKKYKIHILVLRGIVLVIPVAILTVISFLEGQMDKLVDYLYFNLPDPKK